MNKKLKQTLDGIEEAHSEQHRAVALKYLELVCADAPPTGSKLAELDDEVNKLLALDTKRQLVIQVATNLR